MSKHDRDFDDEAPLQQSIKKLRIESGQDNAKGNQIAVSNQEVQSNRRPHQTVNDQYVPVNSLLHQLHMERQYRQYQRNGSSATTSSTDHSSMDVE